MERCTPASGIRKPKTPYGGGLTENRAENTVEGKGGAGEGRGREAWAWRRSGENTLGHFSLCGLSICCSLSTSPFSFFSIFLWLYSGPYGSPCCLWVDYQNGLCLIMQSLHFCKLSHFPICLLLNSCWVFRIVEFSLQIYLLICFPFQSFLTLDFFFMRLVWKICNFLAKFLVLLALL